MHSVFERFDNALAAIWAPRSITKEGIEECSRQEAEKKDKLNACVRGVSKQIDMQIVNVEEISDEELNKKELNEKGIPRYAIWVFDQVTDLKLCLPPTGEHVGS